MTTNFLSYLILTAPNELLCSIYQYNLNYLSQIIPLLSNTICICISDPIGIRIGSGGGTLNALSKLINIEKLENIINSKVIIIHSGGDSRRSPLQSLIGKAWTQINTSNTSNISNSNNNINSDNNNSDYYYSEEVSTALTLLIHELEVISANMDQGSLIIASSDVLVNLKPIQQNKFPKIPSNAISLITVSEVLDVAKNHGVIGINKLSFESNNLVLPTTTYLQKPSINDMITNNTVIHNSDSTVHNCKSCECRTLIDTGIVVVSGSAFQTFLTLTQTPYVNLCTEKGMRENPDATPVRLELYSDFLHALSLINGECTIEDYFHRVGLTYSQENTSVHNLALIELWKVLKTIPFYTIYIEQGIFYHLGTTQELLNLLTIPIQSNETHNDQYSVYQRRKLISLYERYQLQNHINSKLFDHSKLLLSSNIYNDCDDDNLEDITLNSNTSQFISMNSYISLNSNFSSIGVNSVLENSFIYGDCFIGNNSIVSYIQGYLGHNLNIPPNIMFQHIPIRSFDNFGYILLTFGIYDNIKGEYNSTDFSICGVSLNKFLEFGKLQIEDIWADEGEKTLWNARLFPIHYINLQDSEYVQIGENKIHQKEIVLTSSWFMYLNSIINNLVNVNQISSSHIETWKSATRLSLKDILSQGNITKMISWKLYISLLCQEKSILLSSLPVIHQFTTIFNAFEDFSLKSNSLLFSNEFCLDKFISLTLGLSIIKLCSRNTSIIATNYENIQKVIEVSNENLFTFFHTFQIFWNNAKVYDLIPFINSFLIKLTHLYGSSNLLLTILYDFIHNITFLEYPRFILLLNWLVENQIIEIKDSINEILIEDSPRMLIQLLNSLNINEKKVKNDSNLIWLAQATIRHQLEISYKLQTTSINNNTTINNNYSRVSYATSPVRIDLSGGWSDTPPISYEYPGSVVNVAINIDETPPLWCKCSYLPNNNYIYLKSMITTIDGFVQYGLKSNEFEEESAICTTIDDLFSPSVYLRSENSIPPSCVLIRSCIVISNIFLSNGLQTLEDQLKILCNNGGLEIISCSLIPSGSGMGGSSILAAVIIKALYHLIYPNFILNESQLVMMVGKVEQLLTTGGGWQDQIGGIYPGFKRCYSDGTIQSKLLVDSITLPIEFLNLFTQRTFLIYSGVQRLAKNTLINALKKHSQIPFDDVNNVSNNEINNKNIVKNLIINSIKLFDILQSNNNDFNDLVDQVGKYLNSYWSLKKQIATGTETHRIKSIFNELNSISCGLCACGAGAGGFIVCILKKDFSKHEIEEKLSKLLLVSNEPLTIHTINIDSDIKIKVSDIIET